MSRSPSRLRWLLLLLLAVSIGLNVYQFRAGSTDAAIVESFHKLSYGNQDTWAANKWLGVTALQNPNDAWIIQEIISETKPDLIVETGTWHGGGALYWAHVLEEVNADGRVLTIDIQDETAEARKVPLWQRRIEFLKGSSIAPSTFAEVEKRAKGKRVLVILDSDHSKSHVLAEMKLFAPLVSAGSYMIVQDSNVNGHPVRPDFGPGPWEAIDEFLPQHPEFESDRSRERQLFTMHPRGYLKKVR